MEKVDLLSLTRINKPIIREYKNSDKQAVLQLLRLNTPLYFSPGEEKDLLYYLENALEFYFVLELEGYVVGSGGFNFSGNPGLGKISWDLLHPQHQGKGLGSLLLEYRLERLKQFSAVKTIMVRTTQLTYQFYEKKGFRLVETAKDYWAKGFDLYQMEYIN